MIGGLISALKLWHTNSRNKPILRIDWMVDMNNSNSDDNDYHNKRSPQEVEI
jgi:hypothetical protein